MIKDFSATDKWKDLRVAIGVTPEKERKFQEIWKDYRHRICIDFDVDDMIPLLNKELDLSLPKTYSLLEGFINGFEKNKSIWPLLEKIKQSTKIGLLTNMYPRMLDAIRKKGILPRLDWDLVVDSSIVGFQKPDIQLFELAQKEARVNGKDILFIDNQEKHARAAEQFGWQTHVYDSSDYERSSKELGEFLDHVGIL